MVARHSAFPCLAHAGSPTAMFGRAAALAAVFLLLATSASSARPVTPCNNKDVKAGSVVQGRSGFEFREGVLPGKRPKQASKGNKMADQVCLSLAAVFLKVGPWLY